MGSAAAYSEQKYLYDMEINKRKLLFLKTFRALLNESGTFGVYPKPPNKNLPSKTQTVLKVVAQQHTGQGAQAVLALPALNKTIRPPDNLEIRDTHPGSAAQTAQHMSETAQPAKHHGKSQQNMLLREKLSIYTENQHRFTFELHIPHWHKPVDRELTHKRWINRLPNASIKFNTNNIIYPILGLQLSDNRKRHSRAVGDESQLSPKRSRQRCHATLTATAGRKQENCETNKTACQKPNRETPASRHTVDKRTHGNANEMGKSATRSKTKKNQMAQDNERGNIIKDKKLYSLNTDNNADNTNSENTQHLDAASTQPDAAVTSQGTNAGDPSVTLPGMVGIVEGKRDAPNDQVMDDVVLGQQMSSTDSAPPVSLTTGIPVTQNAPAIDAQPMTAGSSDNRPKQPLPHP